METKRVYGSLPPALKINSSIKSINFFPIAYLPVLCFFSYRGPNKGPECPLIEQSPPNPVTIVPFGQSCYLKNQLIEVGFAFIYLLDRTAIIIPVNQDESVKSLKRRNSLAKKGKTFLRQRPQKDLASKSKRKMLRPEESVLGCRVKFFSIFGFHISVFSVAKQFRRILSSRGRLAPCGDGACHNFWRNLASNLLLDKKGK